MTAPRWRSVALLLTAVLVAGAVPIALRTAEAAPSFTCNTGYVDETLANGARWQLCLERRNIEGIVLHDVTYTPPGGQPVEILGQAAMAEIHVPYDNNWARFHDLSDIGLGYSGTMDVLDPAECPNGTILQAGGEDVICQTEAATGYAYKSYDQQAQGTSLNLFSVSILGAYNYVIAWNLDDDGSIRPEVGATGALQLEGGRPSAGWPLGGGRSGVAHMHNFYWRLDFDVDGRFEDRVEELEAVPLAGTGRRELRNTRRSFTTEVARRVAPGTFRSWRIRDVVTENTDGHPISVEVLPNTDHIYRGPAFEGFTHNELYVTRYRSCERFASNNPGPCAGDVDDFVNGQGIAEQDLVVWYGTSFHHLPRDEDDPHMHAHWSGFTIAPRDLTAENILP